METINSQDEANLVLLALLNAENDEGLKAVEEKSMKSLLVWYTNRVAQGASSTEQADAPASEPAPSTSMKEIS